MIRKAPFLLICFALACQTTSQPETQTTAQASYYRPAQDLDELFKAVQLGRIFPDSKTFVDSRPKSKPAEILERYNKEKTQPGFNLKRFVEENFELPELAGKEFELNPELSMEDHIVNHWAYLTREADENEPWSSLVPLPNPYVVPGGRFREIYYWDSYFTMYGLAAVLPLAPITMASALISMALL